MFFFGQGVSTTQDAAETLFPNLLFKNRFNLVFGERNNETFCYRFGTRLYLEFQPTTKMVNI